MRQRICASAYEKDHPSADSTDLDHGPATRHRPSQLRTCPNYIAGNNQGNIFDSVTAADVNGNGSVDLISANAQYNTITILTNNGSGGFGFNTTLTVGLLPSSVAAADVNADGKLDLVSANSGANTLSILINNSTFPPPNSMPCLTIQSSGNGMLVLWPSASTGWSLQQNPDLATTNWSPSGYSGNPIADNGTNKSFIVIPSTENLFFRLMHP